MKKQFRIASLLLAALMASQTLVACGSEAVSDNDTTTGDTTPVETEPEYLDDLGDIRFDGETFTMFFAHPIPYYIVEEETGDVLDDAIYARNQKVEERLGIELELIESAWSSGGSDQTAAATAIEQYILAGDDTNDVYIHVQHGAMPTQIAQGYFVDWNTINNIDFSKPYWYSKCLDDINYGDKVYTMTGDYNLYTLTLLNVLFFNKRLLDEAQIEYPYQLVKDGTWTFDKFKQMVADTTRDLNGDTKIVGTDDQIGYWGWQYEQFPAMFMGMGGDSVLKSNDGTPVMNVDNERTHKIIDTMLDFFSLDGAMYEGKTYALPNDTFTSGKLAFLHTSMDFATKLRDMEDDFGFVPYPKLDTDQETYNCRVQNTSGFTYIPITNKDLDFTGAVLECMASISYNTTVPAFFDVALTIKSTRDTDTEEMIPIIRECASFNDDAIGFSPSSMITGGQALATYWASNKNNFEQKMQELIVDVYCK
ncbi:MAG: hypothetical protein IJ493_00340 [Clostridia bacterium]|nr:hypothetical protein [Clostridia bacterium]